MSKKELKPFLMALLVTVSVITTLLFAVSAAFTIDNQTLPYKYEESIVSFKLANGGFCTGFVVSPELVVTAAHCGGYMESAFFLNTKEAYSTGVFIAGDPRRDFAIIKGDFRNFKTFFKMNVGDLNSLTKINKTYLSCGYPEATKKLRCTRVTFRGPRNFFYIAYGEIYPGMSGGPL